MRLEATVDKDMYELLRTVSVCVKELDVDWLLIGATARVLLLEQVYGWPGARGTQDADFAVQVGSWDHYRALCERLLQTSYIESTKNPAKRFKVRDNLMFDLVPYGGVEEDGRRVFWPPDRDNLMTVRGFSGAAKDALVVRINNDLDVPVVSPPGLCALKLFAWEERGVQEVGRDAEDIAFLFGNIERWITPEQLYDDHEAVIEAADYDIQLAGITVLGSQVARLLESDELEFLVRLLSRHCEVGVDSSLIRDLHRYLKLWEKVRITELVTALLKGLRME